MVRAVRRLVGRPFAAAALLLAACASQDERLADSIAKAERDAAEGREAEAVIGYRNALNLDPHDAELHERIGDLLVRMRAHEEAVSYYRQAFQLDPERIDAAMSEARLLEFSDPERARELVRLGLERAPERASVQRTRARVALARNDLDEALVAATRASELAPDDPVSWAGLGRVHQARLRLHQLERTRAAPEIFQAALDAFEREDRLAGGSTRARVERARVLSLWSDRREQALAGYRDALALAHQRGDVNDQIFAASALEEFARAERDFPLLREALRAIVAVDEDDYASWESLAKASRDRRAEQVCRELLEKRPDDPQAHRLYARDLVRRRRSADALAHLRRAIDDGIVSPILFEQIQILQIRSQQLADARATYVELADEFPDDAITRGGRARLLIAEGRPAEAAVILRELVKSDESAESQRMLAVVERQLGNLPAAGAAIERSIGLAPGQADLYRLKARIHYDAKEWRQVIFAYRMVASRQRRLAPSDQLREARALYEVGNPKAGRELLEALLARRRPASGAVIEFARREGAAQPERARAALAAALARSPGDDALLEALVDLDRASGRVQQALAQLDTAFAAGRAGPRTLLLRARVLAETGNLERAEADVLRAFEEAPLDAGAAELLFEIYRRQGRLAEAQRSFEEAEAAGVLHSGARLLLGRMYASRGERAKAQQAFERVLAEHPELASAKNDLAYVLAEQGEQLDRALVLAREAQQAMAESPAAFDTLGYVHFRAGRFDAALVDLQRAIALAQKHPGGAARIYAYHLGLVLQALGRKQEAAGAFEQALGGAADFPEAEDARRRLEAVLGTPSASANPS